MNGKLQEQLSQLQEQIQRPCRNGWYLGSDVERVECLDEKG